MHRSGLSWLRWALVALPWLAAASYQGTPAKIDFAREIAPILKSKCVSCHSGDQPAGALSLDTIDGIRKGGKSGKLWEPFKGSESLLVKRLNGTEGRRMPMGFAPLGDDVIAKVKTWIDQGAVLVDPSKVKNWAYTPPISPNLPKVSNPTWCRNGIDRFVLARLDKEHLTASPEAPKETLARRAALDITGLPPTIEELDAFLADKRSDAYERYVDKLLASPHYGERMARIWLDLARYADTNGYEKDLPRQMWAWRDWVINAFNRDMPYDEFTIEQLAGDLLPNPTRDQIIATGFHRNSMLNDEGGIDPEEFRVVAVIDRVDATATTWLGSTLACAQCHDHKYDPFSQGDYYSFFACFNQSEDNGRDTTPILRLPTAADEKQLAALSAQILSTKKDIDTRLPGAMAKMPAWEGSLADGWQVLRPTSAVATGANLKVLDDGSALASGPDPAADLYTITLPLSDSVSGLRIEAIPDPSLPEKSSGRNFNGNFVLRRVEAKIVREDGSEQVFKLTTAKADFSQQDFDPASVLRDDGLGWAIAGFQPENRVIHSLVLSLATQIQTKDGDRLVITLKHQTRFPNHNLGRFRISVTSDADLAAQTPPTMIQRAILGKPANLRTKEEQKELTDFYISTSPNLAALQMRRAALQKQHDDLEAKAPTVMVMRDLAKPRANVILKRGDFRTPGDPVSPASPKIMGGRIARPDRLGLARWMVSPKNPIAARVEANRLWEQCFGRGLVGTPEDFGTQGDPPSHPELLDWLATELIAKKWSMKALLKEIVTSATYRQSSKVSADLVKRDPYNVHLARGPRFRVEAEMVRDIALAASGRLTTTIGGPSVMPPQPGGIWENSFTFYDTKDRWVDADGPNRYRRGLYTFWRRTAPFPMELTFDLKSRDMCIAHRARSNSPLQALNTLNDPEFVECAGGLAQQMVRYTTQHPSERPSYKAIEYGFRCCTSRKLPSQNLPKLVGVFNIAEAKFRANPKDALALLKAAAIDPGPNPAGLAAYVVVANTLLNLDETITKS